MAGAFGNVRHRPIARSKATLPGRTSSSIRIAPVPPATATPPGATPPNTNARLGTM
jgi:hypothetical protein